MSRAPHRFYYAGNIAAPGTEAELPAAEAHHVLHVLRLRAGAAVEVFDAGGAGWRGELMDANERGVARVRVVERLGAAHEDSEPGSGISLAVCLLKHRGMDMLIEKASELGVGTLQPLVSARTVVQVEEKWDKVQARWERIALAAAKQSGRNRPLEIAAPLKLEVWVKGLAEAGQAQRAAFAHFGAGAVPLGDWLGEMKMLNKNGDSAGAAWVAIGPEGGWTEAEAGLFVQQGVAPVALGRLVLRAETAALAAAAAGLLG